MSAAPRYLADSRWVGVLWPLVVVRTGNDIDDAGAEHLAGALRENKTVTSLNLGGNGIGAAGAEHLAGALRENKTVKVLGLPYLYLYLKVE